MRAVIFAGGRIDDYALIKSKLLKDDYVIAADSGYDHLLKMGVRPDIVIGDFDSINNQKIEAEIVKLNPVKDDTDTEAAINLAIDKGASEIVIFSALGARQDHAVANMFLLKILYQKGIDAKIVDENNEIYYFFGEITLSAKEGELLSIIPISDLEYITTDGLLYELNNDTLKTGYSRGISNVFTKSVCKITALNGDAFVIKSKD